MGPPPRGVFGTPPSLFPALNKDGDDSGSGKAAFFLGPGPCQRHAFHPPGGDRAPNSLPWSFHEYDRHHRRHRHRVRCRGHRHRPRQRAARPVPAENAVPPGGQGKGPSPVDAAPGKNRGQGRRGSRRRAGRGHARAQDLHRGGRGRVPLSRRPRPAGLRA